MADVMPKRKPPVSSETVAPATRDEKPAFEKVLLHPNREERLKSAIEGLTATFPTARKRASEAILTLIDTLSGDEHTFEQSHADKLKVKLFRALVALEAIHDRPESVSKEELESLKQAMDLLQHPELTEPRTQAAGDQGVPKRPA